MQGTIKNIPLYLAYILWNGKATIASVGLNGNHGQYMGSGALTVKTQLNFIRRRI
jgi:hypothetical protein